MIVGILMVIVLLGIIWFYLRYVVFRYDLKYLFGG